MGKAGTVWVDVRGDMTGFNRDMAEAARSASRSLGSIGMGAAKTVVTDLGRVTAQAVAGFTTLGAVGTASLVSIGASYNTLEQSSLAAFKTLLGTEEAAKRMQGDLREFAKSSPFPRQAFIEGTQRLLAFGFEAKQVIPTLDAIQNAVAAAGGSATDLSGIVEVLAKIRSSAAFSVTDLNELGNRGLNAAKLIGETMGMTEMEFRDSIFGAPLRGADALAALDNLVTGMSRDFAGAADGLKNTWVGATDRIKGAWRDIGSDLVEPFISKGGGGAAVEWANGLADSLRHIQKTVIPALGPPIAEFVAYIDQGALSAGRLVASLTEGDVSAWMSKIGKAAATVRSDLEGMEGVAVGAALAIAGLGARTVLGPLGFLVPAISPITGVLGGLVAGSKEGRDMLRELGGRAKDFAAGPGRELLRSVAGLSQELSRGLVSLLGDAGNALFDAGERAVPLFVDAIDELGPPIGDILESLGELVESVLPTLVDLAGTALPPAVALMSSGLGLAADALGLVADNADLVLPALGMIATYRMRDTFASWAGAATDFATGLTTSARDFGTYFQVLRSEGGSIAGSLSGAATASGGLTSGLGLLNPAVLGVTAAVGLGIGAYQAWATAKADAERHTKSLTDALLGEGDALGSTVQKVRENLSDFNGENISGALNATGLSVRDISQELRAFPGEMDTFRGWWHDVGEDIEGVWNSATEEWLTLEEVAANAGVKIPESVLAIQRAFENGDITAHQARQLVDAFVNADKATAGAADNLVTQFNDMKAAAEDAGVGFSEFERRFNAATTFEERKAVLDDFKAAFPELADSFDLVGGAAEAASRNVSGLLDRLEKFAGIKVDADEAARRYAESIDRMRASFTETTRDAAGNEIKVTRPGISDTNDPNQRRNADNIKAAVDEARRGAAVLAQVDTSGNLARQRLNELVAEFQRLAAEGKISNDEFARLLELYELSPEQIETQVTLNTTAAIAELEALTAEFDAVKATLTGDQQMWVQTLIDNGHYNEARVAIDQLTQDRTVRVRAAFEGLMGKEAFESLLGLEKSMQAAFPKRATGGVIQPNRSYWVGENGPEMIVSPHLASVIPTSGSGGGRARVPEPNASAIQEQNELLRQILDKVGTNITVDATSPTGRGIGLDIADTLYLKGY